MDSARVLGAEKVIAIDKAPYRLDMAAKAGYLTIDFKQNDVRSTLLELTGGRGPDECIDAVAMESAHGSMPIMAYDRAKQAARLETDRPRQASRQIGRQAGT